MSESVKYQIIQTDFVNLRKGDLAVYAENSSRFLILEKFEAGCLKVMWVPEKKIMTIKYEDYAPFFLLKKHDINTYKSKIPQITHEQKQR